MPNKLTDNIDNFSTDFKLKSGQKTLNLRQPVVMGILNLTPDSFFSGSRHQDKDSLLRKAEKHIKEGAGVIDIGAVSTRPGAVEVSEEKECERLLSSLILLRKTFPEVWISIDTWRSSIADQCIAEGADIINDISGGSFDNKMPGIIGKQNTPYILMHIKGKPQDMQDHPVYSDPVSEIGEFFKTQSKLFKNAGATQIVLDPGFGFGKTLEHNYHLLKNISTFQQFGMPILAGISRKSMVYKPLGITAEEALNGTSILNTIALLNGVNILRVHDVKQAIETIKIIKMFKAS